MPHRFDPWCRQARTLPEPSDYFSGRRRAAESLPDNVLCFVRKAAPELPLSSGADSFHERWVLLLALRGSGVLRLDRTPHRLRPGKAVLIPPLRLHGYPRASARLLWLYVTFEWPGHTAQTTEWSGLRQLGSQALGCLTPLIGALKTPGASGNVTAALLLDLLRALYPSTPHKSRIPLPHHLLARVQVHASRNPPLAVPELARRLGLSESHLRARFRRETGMSVGRYLRETRLREAARRLREHGGTVKEAAQAAGYPDAFTFSRAFRRTLGVPPSSVRPRADG